MESFLRAVGLAPSEGTPLCEMPVASRRRPSSADRRALSLQELRDLLPDLAGVAAGTEPGILSLEDEARSLEYLAPKEALELLRRWSEALKRRARAEESLVSFKAQFLRSNALEKAFQGLRKNEAWKHEMADRPLFSADGSSPAEVFAAELRSVLQLSLPRAASQLAQPLQEVLSEPSAPPETVAAALTALRAFKEDWREAVRAQAAKSLERRLDSLKYELQKMPCVSELGPARRVLRERVAVLALLLQALADLRLGMETRGAEIDSALVVLGLQTSPGGSNSSRQTGTTSTTAESSSRSRASSAISDSSKGTEEPIPEMPNLADCEAAVDAMVTKTEHGMREGLRLLRLPTSPLHFVPGSELRLRGHDIRVAVCSLIAHWLEDEKPAFFDVLQRIHQVLRKEAPPARDSLATSELVTLRETLRAERRALLDQLEGLDERLRVIDEQLNLPTVVQDVQVSTESGTLFNCGAKQSASEDKTVEPRLNAGCQLAGALSGIAETLAVENQRSVERFGAQLQLRRAELLSALREHLAAEEGRLSALVVAPSGVVNAAQVAAEAVYGAFEENRQLCDLVQKALGPASSQVSELCAGSRCRARWMDGNYYDATIHTVLPDGSVVVNWLRPRPGHECKERPLRTISGVGGDDTLHRILQKVDIHFEGLGSEGPSGSEAALSVFQQRRPQDRRCADCGAEGPEWASISFGIYLCATCVEEHKRLGPSRSLVRQLNDGWGWTKSDLKYMTAGGNEAFLSCLEEYPEVKVLPAATRYSTRLAEYYRRHLDALCTGAQLPGKPSIEIARQPLANADFLSRPEALEAVKEAAKRFEDAAKVASSQCKLARSASLIEDLPPALLEAPRSMSEALKSRRRKVSC